MTKLDSHCEQLIRCLHGIGFRNVERKGDFYWFSDGSSFREVNTFLKIEHKSRARGFHVLLGKGSLTADNFARSAIKSLWPDGSRDFAGVLNGRCVWLFDIDKLREWPALLLDYESMNIADEVSALNGDPFVSAFREMTDTGEILASTLSDKGPLTWHRPNAAIRAAFVFGLARQTNSDVELVADELKKFGPWIEADTYGWEHAATWISMLKDYAR